MFIIWLCWLFRFWKGDWELEVRTATYGPGIDQSQYAKSVSHIIELVIAKLILKYYICLKNKEDNSIVKRALILLENAQLKA